MKKKIREILVKYSDNKKANDKIEAELLNLFSVSGCFYIFEEMDTKAEFGCIANDVDAARIRLVSELKLDKDNLAYKCSHELI